MARDPQRPPAPGHAPPHGTHQLPGRPAPGWLSDDQPILSEPWDKQDKDLRPRSENGLDGPHVTWIQSVHAQALNYDFWRQGEAFRHQGEAQGEWVKQVCGGAVADKGCGGRSVDAMLVQTSAPCLLILAGPLNSGPQHPHL